MLAVMAIRHQAAGADSFFSAFFNRDLGLAASFAVTSAVWSHAIETGRCLAHIGPTSAVATCPASFRRWSCALQEGRLPTRLERRDAAVMFVDLRDFISFAETGNAGDLAEVLSTYRDLVSETVLRHGGTVDKYIGDGVMAVFGQPGPQPDDVDRALSCAIDLVDALEDWRLHGLSLGQSSLRAGIGLHYGPVVGGVLEAGCHSEFTVIGDTVNVAQRLEAFTKSAGAPLAMSRSVANALTRLAPPAAWDVRPSVSVPGRRLPIDVFLLRRDWNDVGVCKMNTEPFGEDLAALPSGDGR
jgi:adenylate cyclase